MVRREETRVIDSRAVEDKAAGLDPHLAANPDVVDTARVVVPGSRRLQPGWPRDRGFDAVDLDVRGSKSRGKHSLVRRLGRLRVEVTDDDGRPGVCPIAQPVGDAASLVGADLAFRDDMVEMGHRDADNMLAVEFDGRTDRIAALAELEALDLRDREPLAGPAGCCRSPVPLAGPAASGTMLLPRRPSADPAGEER